MLYDLIINDMKEAMKSHDKDTLGTLRMLKSSIDLDRINNKLDDINDELVIGTISKQIKSLTSSIVEFEKGSRNDLIENAKREIELLKKYLPEALTNDEVMSIIDEAIKSINATSMKDMGSVMKEITPKVKGRCDMAFVSSYIKEKLK